MKSDGCLTGMSLPLGQAEGRPAAGTLVVCPKSVLLQWAAELQNKLIKHDDVLTTYSIVSMEVPKKHSVGEDDNGKCKSDGVGFPASTFKSIGWFRVILDEAQIIKNHRTRAANARWGPRAKRRWCLSGTPIQNTINDLYSYFRFLKYYPLSTLQAFHTAIPSPIICHPAKGYLKLQSILKTILVCGTEGTLLDGKPIITLPPEVVELKKEYVAAGTVKSKLLQHFAYVSAPSPSLQSPSSCRGFWFKRFMEIRS
ncbi:hypothetical protein SLEP1_g39972 [Rubroshorea leprosula]|nr:hypothetical protein SLEP1_g39972 [Rubroshorea leprosula]